jgi:hypothetical protein
MSFLVIRVPNYAPSYRERTSAVMEAILTRLPLRADGSKQSFHSSLKGAGENAQEAA